MKVGDNKSKKSTIFKINKQVNHTLTQKNVLRHVYIGHQEALRDNRNVTVNRILDDRHISLD